MCFVVSFLLSKVNVSHSKNSGNQTNRTFKKLTTLIGRDALRVKHNFCYEHNFNTIFENIVKAYFINILNNYPHLEHSVSN